MFIRLLVSTLFVFGSLAQAKPAGKGDHRLTAEEAKATYISIVSSGIKPTKVTVGQALTPYHRVTIEPVACFHIPVPQNAGGGAARSCDFNNGEGVKGKKDSVEYHLYGDSSTEMHKMISKYTKNTLNASGASIIQCYCPLNEKGEESDRGYSCMLVE